MVDKDLIINRIKLAYNLSSDKDLAVFFGLSRAAISNWRSRNSIDYDIVFSKCELVNFDWLLTGRGEMLKMQEVENLSARQDYTLKTDIAITTQRIPLYNNLEAVCGLTPLYLDRRNQTTDQYIEIPNAPKCDGALYATGDSMYPLIKAGDIVLYKQITDIANNLYWGEMYIVSIDMEGDEYITIKYIHPGETPDQIKLISQNQHCKEQTIQLSSIRALALVKASIRFNTMK